MKKFVALAVVLTSLGFTTNAARADHDVDELANTLDHQTEQVARLILTNFRHTAEFQHLYRDAYELHELAHHIHDIVHDGTTYNHMRSDVEQFKSLFHHFQHTVEGIHSTAMPSPAVYGSRYGHGGRFASRHHVLPAPGAHSHDLDRLCTMVDQMAQTVDCLVAEVCPPVIRHQPAPVVVPAPAVPVYGPQFPVIQGRRGGFSFSLRLGK